MPLRWPRRRDWDSPRKEVERAAPGDTMTCVVNSAMELIRWSVTGGNLSSDGAGAAWAVKKKKHEKRQEKGRRDA
ncbi:hypothetical protein BHM03_00031923 [Ensete ventricosum]|nr:hypothetical protein BHM03_00031923 [Ensete ventricosum]